MTRLKGEAGLRLAIRPIPPIVLVPALWIPYSGVIELGN